MKILLQRVKQAQVEVGLRRVGEIGKGYLLLIGLETGDHEGLFLPFLDKLLKFKLFPDPEGRFDQDLVQVGGSLLLVSQFTLSASFKKGKKPSFTKAMSPQEAQALFARLVQLWQEACPLPVEAGEFGAMMDVSLINGGPVTIWLDSREILSGLHG